MGRIYNFSKFCQIKEEYDPIGGASSLYEETLLQILDAIFTSYTALSVYAGEKYSKTIKGEIDKIRQANISSKVPTILAVLKGARDEIFKYSTTDVENIAEKWFRSGEKATEALKLLMEEYKADADELEAILDAINKGADDYKETIQTSVEENPLTESALFERVLNIFSGKAGEKKVVNEITRLKVLMELKKPQEGMGPLIYQYEKELDSMADKLKAAKEKLSKRDLQKKIEEALTRILEIEKDINNASLKYSKQLDVSNKAQKSLKDSLDLAAEARKLEEAYWVKVQREKALRDAKAAREKEQEEEDSKLELTISRTISYDPDREGKENEDVKAVQKMIIEKIGPTLIANSPEYKDFEKYGADGKFGKKTAKIIKIIKVAMGEDPDEVDPGITPEFVRDIQTKTISPQRGIDYAEGKEVQGVPKYNEPKNYENFLKLPVSEKMNWLTSKYTPSNPDVSTVDSSDYSGDYYDYTIYWSGKNPNFPKGYVTVCTSPAGQDENTPGFYQTFEEKNGERNFIETGFWGYSIDGPGIDFKKSETGRKEDLVWGWEENN